MAAFGLKLPAEVDFAAWLGSAVPRGRERIGFLCSFLTCLLVQVCISTSLLHSGSFLRVKMVFGKSPLLLNHWVGSIEPKLVKIRLTCVERDNLQMVGICTSILLLSHLIIFPFFSGSAVVIDSIYQCIFLAFICHFSRLTSFLYLYLYFWQ